MPGLTWYSNARAFRAKHGTEHDEPIKRLTQAVGTSSTSVRFEILPKSGTGALPTATSKATQERIVDVDHSAALQTSDNDVSRTALDKSADKEAPSDNNSNVPSRAARPVASMDEQRATSVENR